MLGGSRRRGRCRCGPAGEARADPLGLLVGERLDVAAVGGGRDQPVLAAVTAQALDELALGLGVTLGRGGERHLRIDHGPRTRPRPRAARPAGALSARARAGALVADLARGVEGVPAGVAPDPHLLPARPPDGGQPLRVGRAVLGAPLQVGLRPLRPRDRCVLDRMERRARAGAPLMRDRGLPPGASPAVEPQSWEAPAWVTVRSSAWTCTPGAWSPG